MRGISSSTSDYLQKRISVLYDLAIKNGHDVIVLGAWGCGAFKETDDDISILRDEYKKALKKYDGKIRSVFAVLNKKTYKIFVSKIPIH